MQSVCTICLADVSDITHCIFYVLIRNYSFLPNYCLVMLFTYFQLTYHLFVSLKCVTVFLFQPLPLFWKYGVIVLKYFSALCTIKCGIVLKKITSFVVKQILSQFSNCYKVEDFSFIFYVQNINLLIAFSSVVFETSYFNKKGIAANTNIDFSKLK